MTGAVNGMSYVHEDVMPNQQHTYRIRVRNAVSTGEWGSLQISQIPAPVFKGTFTAGDEFYFEMDAYNVNNIENARFTITFDPSALDVVDLYAGTENIDLAYSVQHPDNV